MENATVTVRYGGNELTFELSGTGLSEVMQANGWVNRYLSNASRDFIGDEVEKALLALTPLVGRTLGA